MRPASHAPATVASLMLAALLLPGAAVAHAQTRTGAVTATFVVDTQITLALSLPTLTFPDADPDTVPQVPPAEGPMTITVNARSSSGNPAVLTVMASDDFRSGMDAIAVSNLTWTASGPGYLAGTMSRTTAQTVASFASSGTFVGTQNYRLRNSWSYPTGNYAITITYTLSTP